MPGTLGNTSVALSPTSCCRAVKRAVGTTVWFSTLYIIYIILVGLKFPRGNNAIERAGESSALPEASQTNSSMRKGNGELRKWFAELFLISYSYVSDPDYGCLVTLQ